MQINHTVGQVLNMKSWSIQVHTQCPSLLSTDSHEAQETPV